MVMFYHNLIEFQTGASSRSRRERDKPYCHKKANYQGGGVKPQMDTEDATCSGVRPRRRFATSLT